MRAVTARGDLLLRLEAKAELDRTKEDVWALRVKDKAPNSTDFTTLDKKET
jgi:hypothetical protein